MKISPINYRAPAIYKRLKSYPNKNISFRKNIDEVFYPFCQDLIKYAITTPKISCDGIESILHEYSPDTQVDSMENYKFHDIRNPHSIFDMQLYKYRDEADDEEYITSSHKKIYLGFDEYNEENLGPFLAEVIHESTHAFQQEADDRMSYEELIELYLNNTADKIAVKNTVEIMDSVFIYLEQTMHSAYDVCIKNGSRRLKDREKQFEEQFGSSIDDFVKSFFNFMVFKTGKNPIEYNLLYDYCILRARNEEEAYRNMLNVKPKLVDKNTQIGLQIEMYGKLANSLFKLAKSKRIPADAQNN